MSLRLIVMRHAKSDWTDPFEDDHDRVLNPRGRKSATALGKWLQSEGYSPDLTLCSSSVRTQETWALASAQLAVPATLHLRDDLYLASAQKMLNVIQANGSGRVVLLIAHNPGCGTMAAMLPALPPQDANFKQYPTGYTTVLDFAVDDWGNLDWGLGHVVAHTDPRALLA